MAIWWRHISVARTNAIPTCASGWAASPKAQTAGATRYLPVTVYSFPAHPTPSWPESTTRQHPHPSDPLHSLQTLTRACAARHAGIRCSRRCLRANCGFSTRSDSALPTGQDGSSSRKTAARHGASANRCLRGS